MMNMLQAYYPAQYYQRRKQQQQQKEQQEKNQHPKQTHKHTKQQQDDKHQHHKSQQQKKRAGQRRGSMTGATSGNDKTAQNAVCRGCCSSSSSRFACTACGCDTASATTTTSTVTSVAWDDSADMTETTVSLTEENYDGSSTTTFALHSPSPLQRQQQEVDEEDDDDEEEEFNLHRLNRPSTSRNITASIMGYNHNNHPNMTSIYESTSLLAAAARNARNDHDDIDYDGDSSICSEDVFFRTIGGGMSGLEEGTYSPLVAASSSTGTSMAKTRPISCLLPFDRDDEDEKGADDEVDDDLTEHDYAEGDKDKGTDDDKDTGEDEEDFESSLETFLFSMATSTSSFSSSSSSAASFAEAGGGREQGLEPYDFDVSESDHNVLESYEIEVSELDHYLCARKTKTSEEEEKEEEEEEEEDGKEEAEEEEEEKEFHQSTSGVDTRTEEAYPVRRQSLSSCLPTLASVSTSTTTTTTTTSRASATTSGLRIILNIPDSFQLTVVQDHAKGHSIRRNSKRMPSNRRKKGRRQSTRIRNRNTTPSARGGGSCANDERRKSSSASASNRATRYLSNDDDDDSNYEHLRFWWHHSQSCQDVLDSSMTVFTSPVRHGVEHDGIDGLGIGDFSPQRPAWGTTSSFTSPTKTSHLRSLCLDSNDNDPYYTQTDTELSSPCNVQDPSRQVQLSSPLEPSHQRRPTSSCRWQFVRSSSLDTPITPPIRARPLRSIGTDVTPTTVGEESSRKTSPSNNRTHASDAMVTSSCPDLPMTRPVRQTSKDSFDTRIVQQRQQRRKGDTANDKKMFPETLPLDVSSPPVQCIQQRERLSRLGCRSLSLQLSPPPSSECTFLKSKRRTISCNALEKQLQQITLSSTPSSQQIKKKFAEDYTTFDDGNWSMEALPESPIKAKNRLLLKKPVRRSSLDCTSHSPTSSSEEAMQQQQEEEEEREQEHHGHHPLQRLPAKATCALVTEMLGRIVAELDDSDSGDGDGGDGKEDDRNVQPDRDYDNSSAPSDGSHIEEDSDIEDDKDDFITDLLHISPTKSYSNHNCDDWHCSSSSSSMSLSLCSRGESSINSSSSSTASCVVAM